MVGYRMKVLNFRIKKQVRKYPTNSPIMTILILMSIFYQINMRMRVTPCKMVTNIKMDKLIVIKILIKLLTILLLPCKIMKIFNHLHFNKKFNKLESYWMKYNYFISNNLIIIIKKLKVTWKWNKNDNLSLKTYYIYLSYYKKLLIILYLF